jgi:intracellular septation protein
MKGLLHAGRALLLDMVATLFFLLLYWLTRNITLSVILGLVLAFGQIVWQIARHKPVDTLQWVSLFLVAGSGTATLVTRNPVFVMLKPSLIYCVVGAAMLRGGWLNRYLPAIALETVSDMAIVFGYVWAALMFFSAGLNLYVAFHYSVIAWGTFMSLYGIVSKLGLFVIQYTAMRTVGVRRYRTRSSGLAA